MRAVDAPLANAFSAASDFRAVRFLRFGISQPALSGFAHTFRSVDLPSLCGCGRGDCVAALSVFALVGARWWFEVFLRQC
jgi:hypothetical protein